jgi:hypothetical protein
MSLIAQIFSTDADFFLCDTHVGISEGMLDVQEPIDFEKAIIPGNKSKTKSQLMEVVYQKLKFPEYFGRNWDALYDSLTERLWDHQTGKYVIIFSDSSLLLCEEPEQEILNMLLILKASIENVSDTDCNLNLKIVFLLEDATKSRIGEVISREGYHCKVIKA